MAQLLDSAGSVIYPVKPVGAYVENISVRHTAADAAGSFVWAMRNPAGSPKTVFIRTARGHVSFDGTAAAGTSPGYEFCKFTGGDPTTGTTVPRVKKRTAYGASVILDANIQQKSGILTITGITNIEIMKVCRTPGSVTGTITPFDLDHLTAGLEYENFELAAGDGFGIRVGPAAAIIGLAICGQVEHEER